MIEKYKRQREIETVKKKNGCEKVNSPPHYPIPLWGEGGGGVKGLLKIHIAQYVSQFRAVDSL